MSDEERLRDAASALRGYASDLTSEIDTLIEEHPKSDGIWEGSAADTFYDARDDVKSRLGTLAGDIRDHATALEDAADDAEEDSGGDDE